jgi:hypothetical protein
MASAVKHSEMSLPYSSLKSALSDEKKQECLETGNMAKFY